MATQTLSTQPREPGSPVTQPVLGPVGWARWAWRSLTSMRTALFLLLLLSIGAVPGSVFPQRSIDAGRVADYLAANPTTGPWLDRLSFFDVYASPWFSAIYLLLVVSLVGCIVPRSRMHWHALRSSPPRAPARLERLDEHTEFTYEGTPGEALQAARTALRAKRFRLHSHDSMSLSAESGYLRESGNLVFHVALCVIIVGVAFGHLLGWRGDVIVPEGHSFSSTVSSYDTFSPGPLIDTERLAPFALTIDRMDVRFEDRVGGTQLGAPRGFTAYTTTVGKPGDAPRRQELSVNNPLTLGGADVFLLGNGYAPVVTVRDAAGAVLYRQATPFLAQDNNYKSVGAVKVPAARPRNLAFSGFFLPTADPSYANGPVSMFPDVRNPELALSVWEGDLFPGGRPQSVYSLDTAALSQVTRDDGQPLLIRLRPGQSFALPGARGSISFDAVDRFAGLSVRTDPGKEITLVSALATLLGLMASLLVKRRRVFVRVRPGEPGSAAGGPARTVVSVGGLAKNADPGLATVIGALRDEVSRGVPRTGVAQRRCRDEDRTDTT